MNKLKVPDGYTIIANRTVLMLVKTEELEDNPGVHAAIYIKEGEQALLQRYYRQQREQDEEEELYDE